MRILDSRDIDDTRIRIRSRATRFSWRDFTGRKNFLTLFHYPEIANYRRKKKLYPSLNTSFLFRVHSIDFKCRSEGTYVLVRTNTCYLEPLPGGATNKIDFTTYLRNLQRVKGTEGQLHNRMSGDRPFFVCHCLFKQGIGGCGNLLYTPVNRESRPPSIVILWINAYVMPFD